MDRSWDDLFRDVVWLLFNLLAYSRGVPSRNRFFDGLLTTSLSQDTLRLYGAASAMPARNDAPLNAAFVVLQDYLLKSRDFAHSQSTGIDVSTVANVST